jgi:acid phosphatase
MQQLIKLSPLVLASALALGGFSPLAQATTTINGVVAGNGYYQHVKVCDDLNGNGRCDAGEPSVTTTDTGAFSLNASVAEHVGLVAEAPVGSTLSGVKLTRALTLRAPAKARNVISPVSTELVAAIESGHVDFSTARTSVAARVGVSETLLLADANTVSDTTAKQTLQTENEQVLDRIANAVAEAGRHGDLPKALRNRLALDKITNVVVIYLENRSFDNLFGTFPGANGLSSTAAKSIKQLDRDGSSVLATLPPAWNGLTAAGQTPVVTQAQTTSVWPNAPFQIDVTTDKFGYGVLPNTIITRDLFHRFFENQMQANGGKNDLFAAWGDAGGLVMGYFDGSKTQAWSLARQYTLADNFFQGAWGGSFLNHQYLICACAPTVPAATVAADAMSVNTLGSAVNGVPQLASNASQQASALAGAPSFKTGNIAPLDYFGAGDGYRAVNTMQPAFQPSGNKPASASGNNALYAKPTAATTLPAQTQTTIGDLLDGKNVSWAWYSGGWAAASANPYPYDSAAGTFGTSTTIYNANSSGTADANHGDFQAHHQPFNYYAKLDPVSNASYRASHLKDRADLLADAASGVLPSVVFYKPVGYLNQHPGYANVTDADAEITEVVNALKASPQWPHTLVLITYDEFGGQFDHAAPPKGDLIGPGTRIPAIVVSPYARKAYVDHTPYDTASVLRFITHRYSLPVLSGLQARDAAVTAAIGRPLGDLTNALDFSHGRERGEERGDAHDEHDAH